MEHAKTKNFVLQVHESGKWVTKTKPADYWTTCKAADGFRKPDALTGWCRVVEADEID